MSHPHQLQLDESTDVFNMSQMIVYGRYIKDGDIKDEFLFCKTLQTMTKADDVLRLVANLFQKQQIKWEKLSSVCTDGAPTMIGKRTGFTTLHSCFYSWCCVYSLHTVNTMLTS